MTPRLQEDADIFEDAVAALVRRETSQAALILRGLQKDDPLPSYQPQLTAAAMQGDHTKRTSLDLEKRIEIYRNDKWQCRYCARKLIVPGILELLTTLCHGFLGLLPGHHMPATMTEPAVSRVYPNVDHFVPLAVGGTWDDQNLVTACTPCNTRKSDRAGWMPRQRSSLAWDGLASYYPRLVAESMRYHDRWLRLLGEDRDAGDARRP